MTRRGLVALALVVSTLTSVHPADPPPKAAADYWPLKVGHKWVYQNADYKEVETVVTVTAAKADGKATRYTLEWVTTTISGLKVTDREILVATADAVAVAEASRAEVDPPVPNLRRSVKPGDEWTAKASVGRQAVEYTFKVRKPEPIKVPAGTYDAAVPVEWTAVGDSPISGAKLRIPGKKWFVAGVGPVRLDHTEGANRYSLVLKSFTPAE